MVPLFKVHPLGNLRHLREIIKQRWRANIQTCQLQPKAPDTSVALLGRTAELELFADRNGLVEEGPDYLADIGFNVLIDDGFAFAVVFSWQEIADSVQRPIKFLLEIGGRQDLISPGDDELAHRASGKSIGTSTKACAELARIQGEEEAGVMIVILGDSGSAQLPTLSGGYQANSLNKFSNIFSSEVVGLGGNLGDDSTTHLAGLGNGAH